MLKSAVIYNFMFFGMQREDHSEQLDGHIGIILDTENNVFHAYKDSDYGGFQWVNENKNKQLLTLNESEQRVVNDAIVENKGRYFKDNNTIAPFELELIKRQNGYAYHGKYVSKNIHHGDTVINTQDGDNFTVNGNHDIAYINKNQFYHLVCRKVDNPKPVKLDRLKQAWRSKLLTALRNAGKSFRDTPDNIMFNKIVTDKQLKNFRLSESITLNNKNVIKTYYFVELADWYLVTINDKAAFCQKHSISKYYHDFVDIITGNVRSEYDSIAGNRIEHNLLPTESKSYCFSEIFKGRYKLVNETESYHYNNKLISLVGSDR